MPRESVASAVDEFVVQVGWGPAGVQVATEMPNGKSMFWQLFGESTDQLGQAARDAVAAAETIGPDSDGKGRPALSDEEVGQAILDALDVIAPTYRGLWATIDRADCNRLIRLLRKARDASFGRDE